MNTGGPWWIWFLPFVFGLPWIVAIAWFWKKTPRRTEEPPSLAELGRRRLWS